MDDPLDFMSELRAGDLVYYAEYYYYPGMTTSIRDDVVNGDIGIVVGEVVTVLGYRTYEVWWVKAGYAMNVARANLKLAYTIKPH